MRISNQSRACIAVSLLFLFGTIGTAAAQDLSLGWVETQGISNMAAPLGLRIPEVGASHMLVSVSLNVRAGCAVTSEPQLQVSCGDPFQAFRLQRTVFAAEYPLRGPEGDRAPVSYGVNLDF